MIKAAYLLPALAALAVAATACSNESQGQPLPTSRSTTATGTEASTPATSDGAGESMKSLDPCTLLTLDEVNQFDADAGVPKNIGGARGCMWLIPDGRGLFSVNLRSGQGLQGIAVGIGKLSDQPVGSHKGKVLKEDGGRGTCMVAIGITESSRVDVLTGYKTDTATACDRATRVATMIEPRLPKGE